MSLFVVRHEGRGKERVAPGCLSPGSSIRVSEAETANRFPRQQWLGIYRPS